MENFNPIVNCEKTLYAGDVDVFNRWKISSILVSGQDLGEIGSTKLGYAHEDMAKRGNFYILSRVKIDVKKYPVCKDSIIQETWSNLPKRTIFPRYYTFKSTDGEIFATLSTLWMICDIESRKLLTAEQSGGPAIPDIAYPAPLEAPGKIIVPENVEPEIISRIVRYSDLDYNGHMNNARYADWICDLFDVKCFEKQAISSFSINYMAEMQPMEEMEMHLYQNGNCFMVDGIRKQDAKSAFRAKGIFADIDN